MTYLKTYRLLRLNKWSKQVFLLLFFAHNFTVSYSQTYTDYLDSAEVASAQGDYILAADYTTKAIPLNGEMKTAYFRRAGYYTASILKLNTITDYENYNAAVADYTQVLKIDSTDYEALFYRGGVHSTMGILEMAVADYNESLAINQNQPLVYNSLAVCYAKMGSPNRALEYINMALSLDEHYAKAYSNRGNIYDMLGDSIKACENWKKGIELGYLAGQSRYYAKCE